MKKWWSPRDVLEACNRIRDFSGVDELRILPSEVGCLCCVDVYVSGLSNREYVILEKKIGTLFGSVGRSGVDFKILNKEFSL